jgi:DNA-binding transcriptional LysR family regulator
MPDWEDLKHFAALARHGTLSAAARELNVEHATVARRIAALENELHSRLVDRRGRRLVLTSAGKRIADLVAQMDAQAVAVARTAGSQQTELTGQVTIAATPGLAAAMLAEPVVELRKLYPKLAIRLLAETRHASLDRREADVAVRLGRPAKGDFIATKVGALPFHLYGSRAYLKETAPSGWCFIGYDEALDETPQQAALRRLAGKKGIELRASTIEMQLALVRGGGGVAILPDFIVTDASNLTRARADEMVRREVWLVYHSDLKTSLPVRTVVTGIRDFLKSRLA